MQIGGCGIFECAFDQLHSVVAAETQIGQEKIDLVALQHLDGARRIGREIDVVLVP